MSLPDRSRVPVILDGRDPFVQVRLYDALLAAVPLPHDIGYAEVDLEPGAYIAHFRTSAWVSECSFLVLPDRPMAAPIAPSTPAVVDSAAPLIRSRTFEAGDADIVADLSRRAPATTGSRDGSLLLVARRRPIDPSTGLNTTAPLPPDLWEGIALTIDDGTTYVPLTPHALVDAARGLVCVHLALVPGTYRLLLSTGFEGYSASQFITVVSERQTQVFLLDCAPSRTQSGSWAAAKMSVHYSDSVRGFDPASDSSLAADEFVHLIATGACPRLLPEVSHRLLQTESPMLTLAVLLSQVVPWGALPDLDRAATQRLVEAVGSLPDAQLLGLVAQRAGDVPSDVRKRSPHEPHTLRFPPMLARSWDLALACEAGGWLRIPGNAPIGRLAPQAWGVGPWLHFREGAREDVALAATQPVASGREVGFSEGDFAGFLAALRGLVRGNTVARVQINSPHFEVDERRLLKLLCPDVDSTIFQILKHSGARIEDDTPTEPALMEALRLPRAAIRAVAVSAITKLRRKGLLPTPQQLDAFAREESEGDSAVLGPLYELQTTPSDIVHDVEDFALPLLAIVYLRYRTPGTPTTEGRAANGIARMLALLGFVHKPTGRRVKAADVMRALAAANAQLADFHQRSAPTAQRSRTEEVEVRLQPPRRYRPGQLCTVERRPILPQQPHLPGPWDADAGAYAYWLSLQRVPADLVDDQALIEFLLNREQSRHAPVTHDSYVAWALQQDATLSTTLRILRSE